MGGWWLVAVLAPVEELLQLMNQQWWKKVAGMRPGQNPGLLPLHQEPVEAELHCLSWSQ